MKKKLFIFFFLLISSFCFAEKIDDIYAKFINLTEKEFSNYLISIGFERYNLSETNGNLYYRPKNEEEITFYGISTDSVIVGYYNIFNMIVVSVKSKGNIMKGREIVDLISKTYSFIPDGQFSYKNGKYHFDYSEYIVDIDNGYLSYSFSNWNKW